MHAGDPCDLKYACMHANKCMPHTVHVRMCACKHVRMYAQLHGCMDLCTRGKMDAW